MIQTAESKKFARKCIELNKTKAIHVNFIWYPIGTFQLVNSLNDDGEWQESKEV